MKKIDVTFAKSHPDARTPEKATDHSSGYDLHAVEDAEIPPGGWKLVNTGVRVAIPEGCEGQVRSRSGLAYKKGIFVLNSPGTIDADYRGDIGVILCNLSKEAFHVAKGDRIAQLVFQKVVNVEFIMAEELASSIRGEGGFGSTGR